MQVRKAAWVTKKALTFMISMEKPLAFGDRMGPRMQEGLMKARGTPILLANFSSSFSCKICTQAAVSMADKDSFSSAYNCHIALMTKVTDDDGDSL